MQEQVVNVSRETEMLRKNQKELLEIKKNGIIELKNAFEELRLECTQLKKESLSLKVTQVRKFQN